MDTKLKLLEILESGRNDFISGAAIAAKLGLSRAAVWKAVRALERDGYAVEAVTNKGYRLSHDSDVLSVQGISAFLEHDNPNIHVYKSLESTNKTAKELAINGCPHCTAVIADTQTAGRGRYGRAFISPEGRGLYISIVLRPKTPSLPKPALLTAAAAVAVCRAIKTVSAREAQIKWVNDVLLNGKKACGILCESMSDVESGGVDWIVAGIGINVKPASFPKELSGIVTSVFDGPAPGAVRNRLAAYLINFFAQPEPSSGIFEEYRSRLSTIGAELLVSDINNTTYPARAVDLDSECRLIVETPDGKTHLLSSGEVSVKTNNCKPV